MAEGEHAVRDREVDVLLIDGNRLEWRGTPDSTLTAFIANAVQAIHIREQADRLGISTEEVARLLVPVTLISRSIGSASNADEDADTVGFITVGALFMMISFYAGFVLTGVVQEKSNRVAEVLLARMPAREVLAGKGPRYRRGRARSVRAHRRQRRDHRAGHEPGRRTQHPR